MKSPDIREIMLEEYKKVAAKLVSFKSVSADLKYKVDIKKTAEFLKDLISSYGFDTTIINNYGNPVILGSYIVNPKYKTSLIYGHYDVVSAEKSDGWDTDPFVMTEKNGKFFGRGIMDDKCQFIIHVLTIGKLIKEKKLGYNIKFLFEGEEEQGSPQIHRFVTDHQKELACDFILISDGEVIDKNPTIELGNRGIVKLSVTVQTSTMELHSGIYGGAAPNAVEILSKMVASFHDNRNQVVIDGFYDDVDEIDKSYNPQFSVEEYRKNTGTKELVNELGYSYHQQVGLRPSLTVAGLTGGYTNEHKTIIPNIAKANIHIRLVASQNAKKIEKLVEKYLKKITPSFANIKFDLYQTSDPVKMNPKNIYVNKAIRILENVFGDKIKYKYSGGTEPVLEYVDKILKKPIVGVPFANEDGHMHGQNENFDIENIKNGLKFSESFFEK